MPDPILPRIARGDERAVKDCLERYGGLVWSLARRMSPSAEDAEDAVQEIFVDVWKSAGRYDPEKAGEATFVATIARRRLIDRIRASGRRPQSTDLEAAGEVANGKSEGQLLASVDLVRVERALAQLRPEQRQVIELSVVSGLSHSEIAQETGLALGTVKTHARRGLQRVRSMLAGAPAAPGGGS